jgi:hypothetical protein
MVWAVDIEKLKSVVGSKDEKLCRMIGGRFKSDIASMDGFLSGLTLKDALKQIVDGDIPPNATGSVYYYAFKLLVQHFGKFQDNGLVYPWDSEASGPVDAELTRMGVPFQFAKFSGTSLPVKVPYPDDFPMTGWVSNDEVKVIDEAFTKATSAPADSDLAELVTLVRGWFRNAADKGWGLVSYYH